MKRYFLFTATILLLTGTVTYAQGPKAYRLTFAESANPPQYIQPTTTVIVRLTVEQEVLKAGPYARYAQKYLKISVPLADRYSAKVVGAVIDYADPDKKAPALLSAKKAAERKSVIAPMNSGVEFPLLLPDRSSSVDKTTETLAQEAADKIFNIRKRRYELVNGDYGENVYGGGLKAALQELDKMENDLISLFAGRRTKITSQHDYQVVPESGKTTYVLCRISDDEGVLPDSDLSGRPVAIVIAPENTLGNLSVGKADKKQFAYYKIAEYAQVRVMDDSEEVAKGRLPVYQFGRVALLPLEGK